MEITQTSTEKDRYEEMAAFFNVMADPKRLYITLLLLQQRLATADELRVHFGIGERNIEPDLRILVSAGVLDTKQLGSKQFYFIKQDPFLAVEEIFEGATGEKSTVRRTDC